MFHHHELYLHVAIGKLLPKCVNCIINLKDYQSIMHYNTAHRNTANFCLGVSFALILVFILALNTFAQTKGVRVINNSTQKTVSGETYAIVVGISNYPGITPLKFADKDAQMFIDFLKSPAGGNTKPENILPLINGDARAADFNVKGYAWLKQKALKEGDRLYIYFSGHGDAMNEDNYFLLPYDCMPNKEDNNYLGTGNIDMHKVKTLFIKPLAAKKVEVLLIVDACRSNDLPGGQQGQANFSNSLQSIAESKQGEIIMLSTGAGQVAIESSKIGMGHGLFTWYLIAGLSGDADKEGVMLPTTMAKFRWLKLPVTLKTGCVRRPKKCSTPTRCRYFFRRIWS
jgi:hypothetical protein